MLISPQEAALRQQIGAVVNALQFEQHEQNSDGTYTIHDALDNLDAALYDLERTNADPACIMTVKRVCNQLAEAIDLALAEIEKLGGMDPLRRPQT